MKNISLNISGRIESERVEALRILSHQAGLLGIDYFIVGAWARDIILEHGYGIKAPRMTRDMDIGIQVADWQQFEALKRALIQSGFDYQPAELQRLYTKYVMLDIIPFGGIADSLKRISWPPEHEMVMNMLGYEEAFKNATTVRLSEQPVLDILVPTIPGLVIMKLIAWGHNYPERKKDAQDILFMLEKYSDAGQAELLYQKEPEMLSDEGFDNTLAGMRLLGRHMRRLADAQTAEVLGEILRTETGTSHRLITDMLGGRNLHKENTEKVQDYIVKLKQGFNEIVQ